MPSSASAKGTIAAVLPVAVGDSGVYQTSPGLLRRRALGPWAEGIAQYLTIRVGDVDRGRAAYQALVRMLGSLPPEELVEPPGPKAQLYRLARSIADTERAMPGSRGDEPLPWRPIGGKRGRRIGRVREELSSAEAELLELRHARELTIEEIACVVERAVDEVELAIDTAEARARRVLHELAPDPLSERASVYVEAFALERSWREEGPPRIEEDEAGLDAGTLIGGRYQIVERVGVGAFGDVYRAEDVEVHGHQVALKLLRQPSLSESARRSALRELKLNAAVFHPSLVQFKDHGWFEERLWFVMPWYEGETLEARMRRAPLGRAEARRIFEPLARALAALHATGIRHQDIKPENILLTRLPGYGVGEDADLLPVLIDLGVAAEEQETLLGGTPLYFAPEVAARYVAEGHVGPDVDKSADVFALALSLRNALDPDTQEDVPAGAIRAFVERRSQQMPPLPRARDLRYLRSSLERWLSLDPLERPTADELAEELAVLTAPEERRERRHKVLRWLLPMLALFAAAFTVVVWQLEKRAAREQEQARQARMVAADARADLIVADARRRALEEGHAELLDRYEQSRMSRRDLAGQLATAEGQLRILQGELATALDHRATLRDRLAASRAELASTETALTEARSERDDARGRADRLDTDLERSRTEAAGLRGDLTDARRRAQTLGEQLAEARREAAASRERAQALSTQLSAASDARDAAEADLERLRQRIRTLAEALEGTSEAAEGDAEEPAVDAPPPETTAL